MDDDINISEFLRKMNKYLLLLIAIRQRAKLDGQLEEFILFWVKRKKMKDIWKTICRETGRIYQILDD